MGCNPTLLFPHKEYRELIVPRTQCKDGQNKMKGKYLNVPESSVLSAICLKY